MASLLRIADNFKKIAFHSPLGICEQAYSLCGVAIFPEPEEERIFCLERESKDQVQQSFIFQPLDAAIVGITMDDWAKSLKHQIMFASEHYEMDKNELSYAGIGSNNLPIHLK